MKFSTPLYKGTLIRRYKRFLADITLHHTGEVITAHVANPGAMLGLDKPGSLVYLSYNPSPTRKLAWSWELVEADNSLIGLNTSLPNGLLEEALQEKIISDVLPYPKWRREVTINNKTRLDFLLEDTTGKQAYLEVKNVHLMRRRGLGEFPDSKTARGVKHLQTLADLALCGHRAFLAFVVQRDDCEKITIAEDIDPVYAQVMRDVRSKGVEVLGFGCKISLEEIRLYRQLDFSFP